MAVTADGTTLYVAAFGSSKVGRFSTAEIEANMFTPDSEDHITVSGGGPTGLVLNEGASRLYVFTRFDNAVSVVDTATEMEVDHIPLHNPEPASVVDGRPFLYDAAFTSSNGEASCSSCHVFGDFDSLAWDLGNPDDTTLPNNNPFEFGGSSTFHPMKGPMTTQSLRGMANHGPMHWRGDRSGANNVGGSALDEDAAFKRFNPAFEGLIGRAAELSAPDMQAFTDFILQVTYPPNPIRQLSNAPTAAESAGQAVYNGGLTDGVRNCNGCHALDPANGFFGSDGEMSFENETQDFKIAHLRNAYQKIGMFGMPDVPFINTGDNAHTGDQVRGFGFLHDGSIDTVRRFLNASVFFLTVGERDSLAAFIHAFPTNLAPIVGQQITLTSTSPAAVGTRISLMIARAAANECELTVKGTLAGVQRGWLRNSSGSFVSDRASEAAISDATLRAQANTAGQERTYLCVPPGSGTRVGVDRDEDGFRDRDEIDAGSDPADPGSVPGGTTTTTSTTTSTLGSTTSTTMPSATVLIPTKKLTLRDATSPPDASRRRFAFKSTTKNFPVGTRILAPAFGSPDDPRNVGAAVSIYNSAGLTGDSVGYVLPAGGWSATKSGYKYKGASTEPIPRMTIKNDSISIKGGKDLFGYTLDENAQGGIAVEIQSGAQFWCADAPAKLSGNPPVPDNNDRQDKFVGQPKTPAPASCPPKP
jgi:YVTN family beta-propeller protein